MPLSVPQSQTRPADRIAIMFDTFGPYHWARLNAAQRHMEVLGIELCGNSKIYDWAKVSEAAASRHVVLFSNRSSDLLDVSELRSSFTHTLEDFQPDAVAIPGWAFSSSIILLETCLKLRIPAIVLSESTAGDESRKWYREIPKQRIVNLFSGGLVGGRLHRQYLTSLGMPDAHIFEGYDVVDNDYFASGAAEARAHESEVRQKHGLPGNYFLASARFIEKKNLSRLLQAYASYRRIATKEPWSLLLLGDGRLRSALKAQLAELNLLDHVQMPGFIQYDQLPLYYALAGAFIHASTTEPWGLVVNEAMASGLAVLVSQRCGCSADLVREGENGFTFNPENIEEMSERMALLSHMPIAEREKMGSKSLEIILNWSPERFALALQQAAAKSLTIPQAPLDLSARLLLSIIAHRRIPCG